VNITRCVWFVLTGYAFISVGCRSPETSQPQQLKKFDFLIDWQAEPTYLGIYYARDTGQFRRLGLDVSIIQSWGANQAVTSVASGRYQIATASGGATVLGYNNGEHMVSLAVLYPKVPSVVYGLASTGVKSPADLVGKTIGIYPASITKNEFDAFMKQNHLDPSRLNVVSLSGPDVPLLLAHKVDAVLHYTEMSPVAVETNPAVPGKPGLPKTFELKLAEYGVAGYGLNIVTSRDRYSRDPEFFKRVTAAAVEGYRSGCAEPDKAVSAFMKDFPEKDPKYVAESWRRVCQLTGPSPGGQTAAGWKQTIDLYQSLGLIRHQVEAKDILP
jgi:NitT/TauT family transport system substrate-binding protein